MVAVAASYPAMPPASSGPPPRPPDCPDCRDPLSVDQPDIDAPELLVGHCFECGALFMVGEASRGFPVLGRAGLLSAG